MARKTSLVALQQISDINMTPLMDLTFILLITFIITFPLVEQGVAVRLPQGKAADLSSASHRTISLNAEQKLFFDDQPITRDALLKTLQEMQSAEPDSTIYLRADRDLPYGEVMELMRVLHDAHISRVALITLAE